MTCREFADFLMDYLDAALPAEERRSFEAHIDLCPECVSYLESYKTTVALGKSVCDEPDGPVPEDVPEDLVRAILAARRTG